MNQHSRQKLLPQIISEIKALNKKGIHTPVVFDLDSTLLDVSPRIAAILRDYAKQPRIEAAFPGAAETLARIQADPGDYGVKKPFQRIGLEPHDHMDFFLGAVEYWHQHFFSNKYLKCDTLYPGAKTFIEDLVKAGAAIYYLTGRDVPRMLQGTIESLEMHGLPLADECANLKLKPDSDTDDAEFKKIYFEGFKDKDHPIWFFENEPVNIHLIQETSPQVKIIFVETVHSGKREPPEGIPTIDTFVY